MDLPADGCFVQRLEELTAGQRLPAALPWTSSAVLHDNQILLADEWRTLIKVRPGQTVTPHAKLRYTEEEAEIVGREYEELVLGGKTPRSVCQHGDGYLLLTTEREQVVDEDGKIESSRSVDWIYFVNAEGEIEEAIRATGRLTRDNEVANSGAFLAAPMDRGAFIVSDVYSKRQGAYWTAFSYIDKNAFEPFDITLRGDVSMQTLKRLFYARGDLALIATRDGEEDGQDTAYVLVMEKRPWIGQVRRGDAKIEMVVDLAGEYSIPFILDKDPTDKEAAEHYKHVLHTIEQSAMPVSLLVWKNRVFMIGKSAADQRGQTEWHAREVHDWGLGNEVILPVTSKAVLFSSGHAPFIVAVQRGSIEINRGGVLRDFLHRPTLSVVTFPGSILDQSRESQAIPHKTKKCRQIPRW